MMSKVARKRSDIPQALASMDVKALLRRRGVYLRLRENQRLKNEAIPLAAAILKNRKLKAAHKEELPLPERQKYSSLTNAEANDYWEKQIHVISIIEKHFVLALKKIFHDVESKVLARLDTVIAEHPKSAAAQTKALIKVSKAVLTDDDVSGLKAQAKVNLQPLLENVAILNGQQAKQTTGVNEPYIPSSTLRSQISDNVSNFAGSMIDTDQATLTDIIANGIDNGDSVQQIRSSITSNFGDFSTMQAERISRTEVLRASNQSALDAFAQSGVVSGKQWLVAPGACDECEPYDGQTETLDGGFYDNTTDFADGDPPLHPNCRCVIVPVLGDGSDVSDGTDLSGGDDESGFIGERGIDTYHGAGGSPMSAEPMLGNAFYVSRSSQTASLFGQVTQHSLQLSENEIYKITSQTQYDNFIKAVLNKYPDLDVNESIPKYVQALGFDAAEVSENVDPLGGIAIYNEDLVPK